jgi:hypothetical protein
MKHVFKYFLVVACCLIGLSSFAANGDTSSVRVWDKYHMDHYGTFDQWVLFPAANKKHQNIKMNFALGCTSNGQCEWDYTLKVVARQRTGLKDSTLQQAPSFRINGSIKDSINYSSLVTYLNIFDSTTKTTDSVENTPIQIVRYSNPSTPLAITDTLTVWPVQYYRYTYDSLGLKTDSTWVPVEQTLKVIYTPYYDVFDKINNFEIGRFISPYASNLPKTFVFNYGYDVTDYSSLLHDSVEIRIVYEGYSYGFTATVDFTFTEGTPIREAYKIENVYNDYVPYGNPNDPAENHLPAKSIKVDEAAKSVKFRVIVSGHGNESNAGCSEFCAKSYYLKLNGEQFASQLMWKDDCGSNPITAQGGTWIYNRANWCPGELIKPFDYEMSTMTAGNTYDLDLDLDPHVAGSSGSAGYGFETQFIYYKDYAYQNDAAMEDILAPTKNFWHNRYNPICDNAVVKIKNKGGAPLTQATIKFQVSNAPVLAVNWTGNLGRDESAIVTLPWVNWVGDLNDKTFKAWIEQANNVPDENPMNNKLVSDIDLPQVLPLSFIVETRTNNNPTENAYTIKNEQGGLVASKSFTQANTLFRDTITLGYGCYTFNFTDFDEELGGGNGLKWWNAPAQGTGSVRFVSYGSSPIVVLKTFNADFGNFLTFNFRTGTPVGVKETTGNLNSSVQVYPQPASDMIFLTSEKVDLNTASLLSMDGRLIATFNQNEVSSGRLNIAEITPGFYLLSLQGANGEQITKKIVINK